MTARARRGSRGTPALLAKAREGYEPGSAPQGCEQREPLTRVECVIGRPCATGRLLLDRRFLEQLGVDTFADEAGRCPRGLVGERGTQLGQRDPAAG